MEAAEADSPRKGSLNDILCGPVRSKREPRAARHAPAATAEGDDDDDDDKEGGDDDDGNGAWVKRKRKKVVKDGKDAAKGVRRGRRTALVKSPPKEPPVRKSGRLGRLATALTGLPIEMLSEILSHSTPATLLRLSRTAKIFRALLFTRSSRPIWLRAFVNDGFPERFAATDFNEPTIARLIWDKECWICGRLKVHKMIWTLRARYCDVCLKTELLPKAELEVLLADEHLHPDVWSCVPRITRPPWSYAQIHGEFYIGWAVKAASTKLKQLALEDAATALSQSTTTINPSSPLPFSSLPAPTTPAQQASNIALLLARLFPPAANLGAALAHLEKLLFARNESAQLLGTVFYLGRANLLGEDQFLLVRQLAMHRHSAYGPLIPPPTDPTPLPPPTPVAALVAPAPVAAPVAVDAEPAEALPLPPPPLARESRVARYLEAYAENLPKIEKDSRMLEEWQKALDRTRAEERSNAQRDRLDAIVGHLTKAGYSDEDIVLGVTPGTPVYPHIDQPYPLTDRIWRKIGPLIKAFIATQLKAKAAEAAAKSREELAQPPPGAESWRWKPGPGQGWESGWDRPLPLQTAPPVGTLGSLNADAARRLQDILGSFHDPNAARLPPHPAHLPRPHPHPLPLLQGHGHPPSLPPPHHHLSASGSSASSNAVASGSNAGFPPPPPPPGPRYGGF